MKRYGEGNQETFGFLFSSESDKERGRGKGSGGWTRPWARSPGHVRAKLVTNLMWHLPPQPYSRPSWRARTPSWIRWQFILNLHTQQRSSRSTGTPCSVPGLIQSIPSPPPLILHPPSPPPLTCVHPSPPPLSLRSSPLRHSRPLKEQFTAQFMDLLALSV